MATHTTIPAIELEQVTKNYGHVQALKGISLTVEPGEVVAILGPNGAGKTTAIALMIGMRRPSCGRVTLFGENRRLAKDRQHIGVTIFFQENPTLRSQEEGAYVSPESSRTL